MVSSSYGWSVFSPGRILPTLVPGGLYDMAPADTIVHVRRVCGDHLRACVLQMAFVFDPFFHSARTTITLALCSSSSFTMTVCAGIVYLLGGWCVWRDSRCTRFLRSTRYFIGSSVQQPGMRSCLSYRMTCMTCVHGK